MTKYICNFFNVSLFLFLIPRLIFILGFNLSEFIQKSYIEVEILHIMYQPCIKCIIIYKERFAQKYIMSYTQNINYIT